MMFLQHAVRRFLLLCLGAAAPMLILADRASAVQDNADEELLGLVTEWLTGSDADLRTLALEQVRTEAKGAAATQRFAALLPSLPAEGQVGLLQALAERRDGAARPAVLGVMKSEHESVRVAALRCLGDLGTSDDFPLLVERLRSGLEAERTMAAASLVRLPGDQVPERLADQIGTLAESAPRVKLIEIVVERRAAAVVPTLLELGLSPDLSVRQAALAAVGQLGSPEHITRLVSAVIVTKASEREWPEKAIVAIYNRHPKLNQQPMHPVLEEFFKLSGDEQAAVLPAVGRVGGSRAREVVDWYVKHPYPFVSDVGWRALSLWPDASVAPDLLAAVEKPANDQRRALAFKALVRVAGLADDSLEVLQRLDWLKAAARLAKDDDERLLVLKRLSAVRDIESLRFAMSFVEQPTLTEQACQAIVELAHLRWLRDEFKDEFMAALDRVQSASRDPIVQERAQRYKEGKTWTGPGVGS
ncbi:MAG: HEAT repeat domain-containing protein [Pirellulaceae bacterium]|nr:HEAT repeat domain-containing protein [Pirellulaceae bacterium]